MNDDNRSTIYDQIEELRIGIASGELSREEAIAELVSIQNQIIA